VKDCFATAGERDIYTGDRVEIWIINKDGLRKEYVDLKLD
jgi:20S proteasome subunit beta 6